MKITACFILLLTLCFGSVVLADNAVSFTFEVYQHDAANDRQVKLVSDTAQLLEGIRAYGFLVNFSVEIEITRVDSNKVFFNAHVFTLTPQADAVARSFQVEYGLPARIDNLSGKNGTVFSMLITPLEKSDLNPFPCTWVHYQADNFKFEPTAYTDLYYVENTFGDFYWNSIKGLLEERFRLFRDLNNFNLPGKYSVFLCPCPIYSVIWDRRFGMMVDPTRSNAFVLFGKDINSVDPFVLLQASIFRNYGYAPPFLSEGFANYLSFVNYDMKKIVANDNPPPLETLMNTFDYLKADPYLADRMAGSFVRFLINQYKIDIFLKLYRGADDLNLKESIEQTYEKKLPELEKDWRHYLDTVSITPQQLDYYAQQAEITFDYRRMLEYYQDLVTRVTARVDSVTALTKLVRAYFFTGDYYQATETQRRLVELDSADARGWMALGNYQMMNGLYDSAYSHLEKARSLDTTDNMIRFNLALNSYYRGDRDKARELFLKVIEQPMDATAQGESRVMLGNIFLESGNKDNKAAAERYLAEAIPIESNIIQGNNVSPANHLWMGVANIGLGDYGTAYEYLNVALYLETRPFYLGLINLWLGKLADVRGEREIAREHYGRVLALASPVYCQDEARKYLDKPYQQ